jgi:WS/DGAT/MGAT family acyltransferase
MNPDRLDAVGETYLRMESPTTPLHIASVGLFEPDGLCDASGRLRLSAIRRRVDARLAALPRLRQRLLETPLGIHRPVWVDDERFDIARHVDAVELGAPHDEAALLRLVERTLMERLDRDRPLWHLRFVTGLADGRVALIERAHHAIADGLSGLDLTFVVLDTDPEAADVPPTRWLARRPPTSRRMLRDGVMERATAPLEAVGRVASLVRSPSRVRRGADDLVRLASTARRTGMVAPSCSLNGTLSDDRRLLIDRHDLEAVRKAGAPHGGTVNDVVLCAVAAGLRDLFLARGETLPPDRAVRVLVPMSTRTKESASLGNRVGGLLVTLPVGIGDPVERLRAIVADTSRLKASREGTMSEVVLEAMNLMPPPLVHLMQLGVERQPLVNMVVTNIPGPDIPLYALGSRLVQAFPIVPLGARMTLEVAILSYDGTLAVCVTADRHRCPDAGSFVRGMREGFAALGVDTATSPETP